MRLEVDASAHRVEDGLGLLVDLLQHVVGVSGLGDGVEFHLEGLNGERRVGENKEGKDLLDQK